MAARPGWRAAMMHRGMALSSGAARRMVQFQRPLDQLPAQLPEQLPEQLPD
jgi:hypothetical protein